MTKVKPTIISPPNPTGLDLAVSQIQKAISPMQFINPEGGQEDYFSNGVILPIAFFDEEKQIPVVYWQKDVYYPAQPNDNFSSITFFYQEDPSQSEGQNSMAYNLNLVHWFNQDRYGRNKGFLIKEQVISEMKSLIINSLILEDRDKLAIYRENDGIFERYVVQDTTLLKYPYIAFRFKIQVTVQNSCDNTTLINLS